MCIMGVRDVGGTVPGTDVLGGPLHTRAMYVMRCERECYHERVCYHVC